MMNEKQFSKYGTAISSIKLCFLVFVIPLPAFRATSIKF